MIELKPCPKAYTADQDKAVAPAETVERMKRLLGEKCEGVLDKVKRVDTGRLGIPVYVSVCGPRAREVMPTRKQMGKGASPIQAEASALMELVERYSYFSFWADESNFTRVTWSEAEALFPGRLMDIGRVLWSVDEDMAPETARRLMDLLPWRFCPALSVAEGREEMVPLDWFKILNEFNGSSAGNTFEESVLQGACELVERHVCAVVDRTRPTLPVIDPASVADEVFQRLHRCFTDRGVRLVLNDFSLGLPAPTVGALAWDPSTFPGLSEIVFTAGTAASPEKAAIRALTEVAQLAGDFNTGRVYEASGLPKFTDPDQARWLWEGPTVPLSGLPSLERQDICQELLRLARGLAAQGFHLYTVSTSHPEIRAATNYNFVPGFHFRERTPRACLGLFIGRILAEQAEPAQAEAGLSVIAEVYPGAYFLPFFQGMAALRGGDAGRAADLFARAEEVQPAREEKALAAFYRAWSLSSLDRWPETLPLLDRAIALDPEVMQFFNLRGTARFKAGDFEKAAADFRAALSLDSGSAVSLANLGICEKRLGHPDEALDYLATALEMDPGLDFARPHLDELLGVPEA